MKNKIQNLIRGSAALNDAEKSMYLVMLDQLSEGKLPALLKIFEDEQKSMKIVESELEQGESQINKRYIEDAEELYKTEYKKAVGKQEKAEEEESENILKQLDE